MKRRDRRQTPPAASFHFGASDNRGHFRALPDIEPRTATQADFIERAVAAFRRGIAVASVSAAPARSAIQENR
jgi:hypothetical protein